MKYRYIALASVLCMLQAPLALSAPSVDLSHTLLVNNTDEPASLDPHKTTDIPSDDIQRQLFEGLLINSPEGGYRLGIAQSWTQKDFKEWVFKLKPHLKWSDGQPITADDLVYSWRRLVDPKTAGGYASYLGDMQVKNAQSIVKGEVPVDLLGVYALDDLTFKVVLDKPVPYFLDMLVNTALSPVPRHVIEKYGDQWTHVGHLVGNGAYRLKNWIVNEYVELERNPYYVDAKEVKIPNVRLYPINSANDSLSRYEAGDLDVSTVSPERFSQVKSKYSNQVKVSPYLCTYYYEMNNTKSPFDNKDVRQALSYLLDRDLLTQKVIGQGQQSAYQVVPPYTNGYRSEPPKWALWTKKERIQKAKALLEKAGYNTKNPLVIPFSYRTSALNEKIAIAIRGMYKEALGPVVEFELNNMEGKTFNANRIQGNYVMGVASWCADYNEASTFLNIFKTGNSSNRSRYSNLKYDEILDKTLIAGTSEEEKLSLYQQAQRILDEDMPVAPIYYYVALRVVKPHVRNYSLKDPLNRFYFKDWTLKK